MYYSTFYFLNIYRREHIVYVYWWRFFKETGSQDSDVRPNSTGYAYTKACEPFSV
jgi:hypothetical protein